MDDLETRRQILESLGQPSFSMLKNHPIYLDYASTTPVDDVVIETLLRYLGKNGLFGNSGSNHTFGKQVSVAIEMARECILNIVNGVDHQLIWTSGATEANNLAIKGLFNPDAEVKIRHIITCKTEHKSVIEPARSLGQQGHKVTYLNPLPDCLIDFEQLARALENKPALVSIMMVNNETGVIQDIENIAALTKQHNSILHCDCSQQLAN